MTTLKSTELGKSYWYNSGAYQKEYDELYKKLVPSQGEAETLNGELIRSASRLYYDYCNNGNCNAVETDMETEECSCCSYCNGSGESEEEEDGICPECGGSGETTEEVEGETTINPFYQSFINKLKENVPNITPIMLNIESFMLRGDCNFSDSEMNNYDRMVDMVMEHVLGIATEVEAVTDNTVPEVEVEVVKPTKPTVKLIGRNSSVFNLLEICTAALKKEGLKEQAEELRTKVFSSKSYDNALCLMMEYCNVE